MCHRLFAIGFGPSVNFVSDRDLNLGTPRVPRPRGPAGGNRILYFDAVARMGCSPSGSRSLVSRLFCDVDSCLFVPLGLDGKHLFSLAEAWTDLGRSFH